MERARPRDIPALAWILAIKFAVPNRGRAVQRTHALLATPLFAYLVVLYFPYTYTRTGHPRRTAAIIHRDLRRNPHLGRGIALRGLVFLALPVIGLVALPLLAAVVVGVVFLVVPVVPMLMRRSKKTKAPNADWTIVAVGGASRTLDDVKKQVAHLGHPGETVGIVAASPLHRRLYGIYGFSAVEPDSLAMTTKIPSVSGE